MAATNFVNLNASGSISDVSDDYFITASASDITITIPNGLTNGRRLFFIRNDITTKEVVIQFNGSETIEGKASVRMLSKSALEIVKVDFDWISIGELPRQSNSIIKVIHPVDLPKPVGNVITLADNTVYIISGTINISPNRLVWGNGTEIYGSVRRIDRIVTSNLSPLITSTQGVNIRDLTLINTTGPIFNVGSSNDEKATLRRLTLRNSSAGTFNGVSTLLLHEIALNSMENGFVIDGNIVKITVRKCDVLNPVNAFTWLTINSTSSGEICQINDNNIRVEVGQTGINLSSNSSFTTAVVRNNIFSGVGTYLTGVSRASPRVLFLGNVGIVDSTPNANAGYSSSTAITTPIGVGTFIPIGAGAGSSTSLTLTPTSEHFSLIGTAPNQLLRYDGIREIVVKVTFSITATSSSSRRWTFKLQLNGNDVSGSKIDVDVHRELSHFQSTTIVFLKPTDTIQVLGTNIKDLRTITVNTFRLIVAQ